MAASEILTNRPFRTNPYRQTTGTDFFEFRSADSMMPVIATFPFQSFPSARLRQPGRGIFLCRVKIQSREERLFNEYFHKFSPLLKTAVSPLYRSVRCLCRSPPYIARYGKAVPEQRQPASCRYMPELRLVETTRYSAP